METKVKSIEYQGYTIEIHRDTDPHSPNNWEDDSVFLVYDHRQFSVKVEGYEPKDIYTHLKAKYHLDKLVEEIAIRKTTATEDEEDTLTALHDDINDDFNDYFIYVVFAYIHSGVSLSLGNNTYPFNDRFDVSSTGFVLVSKGEFDDNEDKGKKAAESLIETWNYYLSGQVYGYIVKKDDKELDSCWGFYGNIDDESEIMQQAKAVIDSYH